VSFEAGPTNSILETRGNNLVHTTESNNCMREEKINFVEFEKKEEKIKPMVIQNDINMELITHVEEDEEFDFQNFKFFEEFLYHHENHPIKDKIEKIIEIFELDRDVSGLSNKMKNEIMRGLKNEYLAELEILNRKIII
jgi:hypothetical protein